MQRNVIRVSVRGADNRISENMLRNVLNDSAENCGCENESTYNNGDARYSQCDFPSLAMVYAPYQKWHKLYDVDDALFCGTLFRELNMPFEGGRNSCAGKSRGGNCHGM